MMARIDESGLINTLITDRFTAERLVQI